MTAAGSILFHSQPTKLKLTKVNKKTFQAADQILQVTNEDTRFMEQI